MTAALKRVIELQDLDPKMLQIALTGFLEKNTSLFVKVRASCSDIKSISAFVLHLTLW